MRVQQVTAPLGGVSWTVIGSDHRQIDPIERYLAWLSAIERSPNTVRAYALDLKTFWVFLEDHGIRWDRLSLEQLGGFTTWLRQPAGNVIVLANLSAGEEFIDGEPDADGRFRVLRVPRPRRRSGRQGAG